MNRSNLIFLKKFSTERAKLFALQNQIHNIPIQTPQVDRYQRITTQHTINLQECKTKTEREREKKKEIERDIQTVKEKKETDEIHY